VHMTVQPERATASLRARETADRTVLCANKAARPLGVAILGSGWPIRLVWCSGEPSLANTARKPIANKYCEGKMKRTLRRESNENVKSMRRNVKEKQTLVAKADHPWFGRALPPAQAGAAPAGRQSVDLYAFHYRVA